MTPSAPEPWSQRHWPWAVVLVLTPLLALGIFTRGLWKPDEVREAAIAARMARPGADRAVPHLAGQPFCEKPPLYYWTTLPAIALAGPSAVAIRAINLLYALAGALLIGALANAIAGRRAALVAGVAMGSFHLAYRIDIWIATDVAMMTTVAGALVGALRGLLAAPGRGKLGWYALMHGFLAMGFLGKNIVAWIVPGLALVGLIIWERRWRELIAWELHAGIVIQVGLILPWVLAVAARAEGAAHLTAFFIDNLAGRFIKIPGVAYGDGHRGWLGKYLVELPGYLAPWTPLALAAAVMAWRHGRGTALPVVERSAWRFAIVAIVPAFLLLSASRTMRDIYCAMLMPPFALLIGLWAARATVAPGRCDRLMLAITCTTLTGVVVLAPPVAAALFHDGVPAWRWAVFAAGWALALGAVAAQRRGDGWTVLRLQSVKLIGAAIAVLPLAIPPIDRGQDLAAVVAAAAESAAARPTVHWRPDETIIGALDIHAGLVIPGLATVEEVVDRLACQPDLAVLAEVTERKGRHEEVDELMRRTGLAVARRIQASGLGARSYAILSRATDETPPPGAGAVLDPP